MSTTDSPEETETQPIVELVKDISPDPTVDMNFPDVRLALLLMCLLRVIPTSVKFQVDVTPQPQTSFNFALFQESLSDVHGSTLS